MKWFIRITLTVSNIFILLALLAFVLPIDETGIDARELVTDEDGQFIQLQGINIYLEDKGTGEAGTLILLHGLLGSTMTWRYNVDALVDAGYRVIAYDRPAFGLSDKRESYDYSMQNQVALTASLMDALAIETAIIIGHSAGGNVATHFAVAHPQRVERLILLNAAVLAGGPPAFVGALVGLPSVWRWARFALQQIFTREQLASNLRGFYADDSFWTEDDTDAYWRAFQTVGWDVGLLGLTRDGGGSLLSQEAIRSITLETVIIWGDEDSVTPLAQGEQLADLLPNSQLIVLEGMGHQPFEEDPQRFNTTLLEILAVSANLGQNTP